MGKLSGVTKDRVLNYNVGVHRASYTSCEFRNHCKGVF